MNYIYTPPSVSVSSIYGTTTPVIPKGMYMDGFRLVEDGDMFLSLVDHQRGGKTFTRKEPGSVNVGGPRIILKVKVVSVDSVYGISTPIVPVGYRNIGFRPVVRGDLFLSNSGIDVLTARDADVVFQQGGSRLILEKLPEPVKNVRVVRVLEYIGPKAWIDSTFKCNGVKGLQVVSPTSTIRELSVFKEEVK